MKYDNISDNEIRIIGSDSNPAGRRRKWVLPVVVGVAALVIIGIIVAVLSLRGDDSKSQVETSQEDVIKILDQQDDAENAAAEPQEDDGRYMMAHDIEVNGIRLKLLEPPLVSARPSLAIGDAVLSDTTVIFATQAADIRGDNFKILGSFVIDGELVSRGSSKAGFCAIINGEISIGMAESTPLMEEAIENDGYFFRQYPLVAGGKPVKSNLKNSSLRKALVQMDGKYYIILSESRLTMDEFANALVSLGAENAIYLVGSTAYGFYRTEDGQKVEFGKRVYPAPKYVNYIIWR